MDTIEAARDAVVAGVDDTSLSRSAVLWAAGGGAAATSPLADRSRGGKRWRGADRDATLTRELLLNGCAEAAPRREPTVIVGTLLLHGDA